MQHTLKIDGFAIVGTNANGEIGSRDEIPNRRPYVYVLTTKTERQWHT